ncbi:MAG: isoprenylcysteine carboxylmethyltransferase family protein [Ignavibacterium sp.]|nr:isoprenylcysteine carboxylmethyltransferase family protein [Ignavibacterium sp.]MDW8375679.1 isoprenylcysteine carboxylmethyltransferase family protein [Ignavibacteriales bacterium]
MDTINLLVLINLVLSFIYNIGLTKEVVSGKFSPVKEKPNSYLQSLPLWLASIIILLIILSSFQIGTLNYDKNLESLRIAGLIVYIIFTWLQYFSFKSLGKNHSPDILIKKEHQLVTKGFYKICRHPQYLFQIFIDLGVSFATLSYLIFPLALIEIPLLIKRAKLEEALLEKHFGQTLIDYKSKTGFFLPFIK